MAVNEEKLKGLLAFACIRLYLVQKYSNYLEQQDSIVLSSTPIQSASQ